MGNFLYIKQTKKEGIFETPGHGYWRTANHRGKISPLPSLSDFMDTTVASSENSVPSYEIRLDYQPQSMPAR